MYSLDIETASELQEQFALEPFRRGGGEITAVTIASRDGIEHWNTYDGGNLKDLLEKLVGQEVWAHFAIFDVSWLMSQYGYDLISKIKWRDTLLLSKWLDNGQSTEKVSRSLAELVKRYVKDDRLLPEFLDVKSAEVKPSENLEYWIKRNKMDAYFTLKLAMRMKAKLPEAQRRGFLIEQSVIPVIARSWLTGIEMDLGLADKVQGQITEAKKRLAAKAGCAGAVMTSPKQLGKYLYETLGIPTAGVPRSEKTGAPGTGKDVLTELHFKYARTEFGPILGAIQNYKTLATLESKFIKGAKKVADYVGVPVSFAQPNIFGTYTGRYTYSSKSLKKYQIGLAVHQLQRKGPVRKMLRAPKGYVIAEFDASAQELRGIGQVAGDRALIKEFNEGKDVHGSMAAHIASLDYDSFMRRYNDGDKDCDNYRYAGKLLNLSCQYRIGANALAKKFLTTYNIPIAVPQANRYLQLYKSRYIDVVLYWDKAINRARDLGYAETIAGRRYYLSRWQDQKWGTESSAINFPIQGFGAEHKNIAISTVAQKHPEAIFILDLHDGLWYLLPENNARELALEIKHTLSTIDLASAWDKEIFLPFPFDAAYGPSFGEKQKL